MLKKTIQKGVIYSYAKQITILVTGFASLPLLLNYFGPVNYGIWILIVGLAEYINAISFGVPSAMTTLVAKTLSLCEKFQILKKSIFILGIISSVFLVSFVTILYFNNEWIVNLVGNVDDEFVPLTKTLFIFFVVFTLIKLPLNLYQQFFVGMNAVYITEMYHIATAIMGFITILLAVYFDLDILIFVILLLLGRLLVNIISVFHVHFKYANIIKNGKSNGSATYKNIFQSGFSFFQVGLAASLVWSTDNLVISHFLSPELVTPYSIAFKIFTYSFMFSLIINGVAGPMYGNAYANNDWDSIRRFTSTIHIFLPIVGAFVWIFLILFAKEIIILWTGKEDAFGGYLLIFSLGLYGYILSFVMNYSTLVFSLNMAKKSLYISWAEAAINLLLSIILIKLLGIGGVALATALASFFACFIFLPKLIKKITNNEISYNYKYIRRHFVLVVCPGILFALYSKDFYFETKIIIFSFLATGFLLLSWMLLNQEDRMMLLNFIRKKK